VHNVQVSHTGQLALICKSPTSRCRLEVMVMRIINRQEFLNQPAGTVFTKYEPCIFGDLLIKGESLPNDFCYQQIADAIDCNDSGEFSYKLFTSQKTGEGVPMDFDCQGRDGCFKDNQLFAIFERADVEKLISRLKDALGCYA